MIFVHGAQLPGARVTLFHTYRFIDTSQIWIFKHFLFKIQNSLLRLSAHDPSSVQSGIGVLKLL